MLKRLKYQLTAALLAIGMILTAWFGGVVQIQAKEKIQVACVGDSLTDGYMSSHGNKSDTAYPAYLQEMLGDDYEVGNFGKSSMTMMVNTDKSYWNTTEFANSKTFEPDIVIIMLGTNDSKAVYWNAETFKKDAEALVEVYENLETNPRVIFAISPQCLVESGNGITAAGVKSMVEVQRELVETNGWETIDMYEKTLGKEALFHPDKVHFTDSGYYYVAQCMYSALTGEEVADPFDDGRDIPVEVLAATAGDSQNGEGPERVLDGDAATLWHTDWYGTSNEKHWIQLEVKENYRVDGLRYQPRQNGTNGIITSYEIFASNDAEHWESVAKGNWMSDSLWKSVSFVPQEAAYIRLVAQEGVSGNDGYVFASAAEIRLTGEKLKPVPSPTETHTPQPTETEAPTPTETESPQPTETPEVKDDVTTVFEDVDEDWYTDYVQYVYDNNLMTGIKGTKHFAPYDNITKAQVAQVLYNMEGQPTVDLGSAKAFKELGDVYDTEWYASAVAWAYETGVATGDLNAKKFSPEADVTREQLALMMYRYAKHKGYDVSASSDFSGLANADKIADWSMDGMKWAVGEGLISGAEVNGVKDLDPQGSAQRAQVAAILQRFYENVRQ